MSKSPTGLTLPTYSAPADRPFQILIIGAHPDDGEVKAGGSVALWAKKGHHVKIVSLTDGRCGHHEMSPDRLVERRRLEARQSAKILGVQEEILNNPDAALTSGIEQRKEVVRLIREWRADLVLTHRPNDYHADHRYGSLLVQDASYLVTVPHFLPEVPPLRQLPVFAFLQDNFQQPIPFQPEIAVDIDSVAEKKLDSLLAMPSQFLEWLPWNFDFLEKVPKNPEGQRQFVREVFLSRDEEVAKKHRDLLIEIYGKRGESIRYAEAFQLCEYGSRPSQKELRKLFPTGN